MTRKSSYPRRAEWAAAALWRGPRLASMLASVLLCGVFACGFTARSRPPTGDAGAPQFAIDALRSPGTAADRFLSSDLSFGGGPDATCATQSAIAQQLPLDLYVMMDSSGSMLDPTATGVTKWQAVRSALIAFLNDPRSAGIGVGLQYFPQFHATVPAQCLADAECGAFGPCFRLRTCSGASVIEPCTIDSQCPRPQTCQLVGQCAVTQNGCAPVGNQCVGGGLCAALPGYCVGRDSCELAPYAMPAVAIGALPGAAPALVNSLNLHAPDGLTPTAPALAGALQVAQRRAATNPNRKVAVVLVTDGFPSECVPSEIAGVASIAATGAAGNGPGAPAVPTFVIGVFAPADASIATQNLNALAQGGGTGSAVVISTSQDVGQALQTALNQIRTSAVACQYQIPPATGGTIDFTQVNVELTSASAAVTTVPYVKSRAGCDATRGGWYYDVDPATGGTPSLISTCDATCTQLRASAGGRVDIVLGCQSYIIP